VTPVPPLGGQVQREGVNSLRFVVRESALHPASPHGLGPRGDAVADRVHLERLARRTGDAVVTSGEVRLGAFTERLLVQHVRGRPPLVRRLLRSIAGVEFPGRERRLPPGVVAGVLAPRGR
jgi:hypothetical protein